MSGRFVRSSKYRHLYGQAWKKDHCYEGLKISCDTNDAHLCKTNGQWISVHWESHGGGGGSFAIIPHDRHGRQSMDTIRLLEGHTAVVLDTDWSPFHGNIVGSASEDGRVAIWQISPEEETKLKPSLLLSGHERRVVSLAFNPVAEALLASGSHDGTVRLWDIQGKGEAAQILQDASNNADSAALLDMAWSWSGSLMATVGKDRHLRIHDARGKSVLKREDRAHEGPKGIRLTWAGRDDYRLISTGFSRHSDRQVSLWDLRNFDKPLLTECIDQSSGLLQPWMDPDCNVLYLAGRGDGNIRFYELDDAQLYYLGEHRTTDPQRTCSFIPKLACSVAENEVARCLKVHPSGLLEPISFRVPRRADGFQADLFPPTASNTEPALTAHQWLAGERADPILCARESSFTLSQELRTLSLSSEALLKASNVEEEKTLEEWKALALRLQRENAELKLKLQL